MGVGSRFDLVAGTSTGGILACGLAIGKTTTEMQNLYRELGPTVFKSPQPDGSLGVLFWAASHLFKAANPGEPLKEALLKSFGDTTLGDVWRHRNIALCLPACRLLDWTPKVFKTPHSEHYHYDGAVTLVEACLATSAAPIFLPPASISEGTHKTAPGKFVDGGLWANNPTLIALLEAIELCADPDTGRLRRPIQILSLGTSGGAPGDDPNASADRGMLAWKFGGEAAAMSIDVQGRGYDEIVRRLVRWVRATGQDITYGRIPNPDVNAAQARELKLDRATSTALDLLEELGAKQATMVQSQCRQDTDLGKFVKSIFTNN